MQPDSFPTRQDNRQCKLSRKKQELLKKMTSSMQQLLQDSQEPEQRSGSEDLFQIEDRPRDEVSLQDIMSELKELRGLVEQSMKVPESFRIQNSRYKCRFQNYLKAEFTKDPWLKIEQDEFKNEVRRILRREGYAGDSSATSNMYSFASTQFTYYRNNMKRAILTKKLQSLSINDLCYAVLRPFMTPGECITDTSRIHLVVCLRAFLHSKRFYGEGEDTHTFWDEFKALWTQMKANDTPRKWESMRDLEERRIKRYREMRSQH